MNADINLIERYLEGDTAAIDELVIKYQKQIYALTYRMTKDIEDAKDLTQKTFIKALKGIRGFKKKSTFKTWLYQIAINASINHLRQNRHEKAELEDSMAVENKGLLTAIIEEEKKGLIKEAMDKLPERQRLSVVLRVYDELSCSETAEVMGCSEGAVKAHYHNGVKRLKEILKERI
ncbi:MAG: sigma-70 family RNA polymerase sigma factor [Nitrospirae bacterium]|nr:sigma-70 family RNA polymerase sigma factor [Nitrospirota bacterium]